MSTTSLQDQTGNKARSGSVRSRQRTINDARQKLTSSSGTKASYDFELLSEYANTRKSIAWGMPILVLALSALALIWVKPLAIGIWAGAVLLTHFAVVLTAKHFLKSEKSEFEARRHTTTFFIVEAVYGLAWASLAMFSFMRLGTDVFV